MDPKSPIVIAVLVTLCAVVLVTPASASVATRGCVPAGGKLLRTTEGVREYTLPIPGPDAFSSQGRDFFVCSDRSRKRARIATLFDGPRGPIGDFIETIRFAGPYVAVGVSKGNGYGVRYDAYIRRIDTDDGTQEITDACPDCPNFQSQPDPTPGLPRRSTHVTDLLVTRHGWIAWIADDQRKTDRYSVGRRDSRGIAIVDRSADVEPRSLAWSETTIYWIAHGEPQDQDLY